MFWKALVLLFVCSMVRLGGAELYVDLLKTSPQGLPVGFVQAHGGGGRTGVWKVIEAEFPLKLETFSGKGASTALRPVLAQTSEDLTDERFPMLIYDLDIFQDFTLSTRFKLVRGVIEKMAGLVFRYQDSENYYYIRASSIGSSIAFFKVVRGVRGQPIRVETAIPAGEWHSLSVEATGNRFRFLLNDKEVLPELTDNTFSSGKIGFWTKSDSVSYFADTQVRYQPRVITAQKLLDQLKQDFPRVLGLKIFAPRELGGEASVIAALEPSDLKEPEDAAVHDCIQHAKTYYAKNKHVVTVTLPLRDRNGDPVAAVRVSMKTFAGQTQKTVLARSLPFTHFLQQRILHLSDLYK